MASPVDLLIVEDHTMFREGLVEALSKRPNLRVLGHCASTAEAVDLLSRFAPHVVLLDIGLGPERSVDFVMKCREAGFAGRILALTAGVSPHEAVQLVRNGVAGIIHKTHSSETLCNVIERVAAGEAYLEPTYLRPLFHSVSTNRRKLTRHETEVLNLVVQGLGNAEIGEALNLSETAAKSVVHELFKKLGVRTRAQLIGTALQEHLTE